MEIECVGVIMLGYVKAYVMQVILPKQALELYPQ